MSKQRGGRGVLQAAVARLRSRRARQDGNGSAVGEFFRKAAQRSAAAFGSSWAFVIAVLAVVIWAATGPLFDYSDTWQLVINTSTTIVTFLMVFIIQNAQNRDSKAFHLKLDELILSIRSARNQMIKLEDCTDEELEEVQAQFSRLARERQRHETKSGSVAR
jgi:low affinity Fe/Cu permease